jgi:CRP/FNR family transcriptional regulator, cyclic AMP receptor protein
MSDASVLTLDKQTLIRLLCDQPAFSELFAADLLACNIRIEADLVDQLFHSSEKRLPWILLLLSHVGTANEVVVVVVIPKVSQERLADMIGTTRERVNFFTSRFRKLGFVEYNGRLNIAGLSIHSSLVSIIPPREVSGIL